jgi:hypothetical protein
VSIEGLKDAIAEVRREVTELARDLQYGAKNARIFERQLTLTPERADKLASILGHMIGLQDDLMVALERSDATAAIQDHALRTIRDAKPDELVAIWNRMRAAKRATKPEAQHGAV